MIVRLPVPMLGVVGLTVFPFVFTFKGADAGTEAHEMVHYGQQRAWFRTGLVLSFFVGAILSAAKLIAFLPWWAFLVAPVSGMLAWFALYLLVLPVGWNYFRRRWETQAYTQGQGYTLDNANRVLRGAPYWLRWS